MDHAEQDRKELDVLVGGGTKRAVKEAAKARHPDVKLKVQIARPGRTKRKGKALYSVPEKKDGVAVEVKRGGRKVVRRVEVRVKKGEKIESQPSFQ